MFRAIRPASLGLFALIVAAPGAVLASPYQQTNLITSATDSDLINPWGIAFSPTSPFWVSDNGTGKSTIYNSAGIKQGLVVTMPVGSEPVDGIVYNNTTNFHADNFIFSSENGTIAGWRGALGSTAEQLYSVTGAVYKGLAISTAKDTLYAANFHDGVVDVFDSTHSSPIGSFSDPTAPAGYAPFNIQNLGGKFYTTFAVQDGARHDDVSGPGNGLVDVFDPTTDTFTRLVTGGVLDSPWGLALAPASFGDFAGGLLVGNFGDGKINAFNATTGALLGTLSDSGSNPIVNPGLWGLAFGNGSADPNALYLTAGGADEASGAFARINAVPEPSTLTLFALAVAGLAGRWRRSLCRS
ncbi:MAG: TIGR03118 family protein [Tepidisphaeraceae bacterium]|jgi:uncharacterized protein (TIGR03118 family)